jgi:hypothetical protein
MIVQTHRDPIETLKSAIQLAEVLEGLFSREGFRGQIGIREARVLRVGMESITPTERLIPPEDSLM